MKLAPTKTTKLGRLVSQAGCAVGVTTGVLLFAPAAFSAPVPQPLISQAEPTLTTDGEPSLAEVQERERERIRAVQDSGSPIGPIVVSLGVVSLIVGIIASSDSDEKKRSRKLSSNAIFWSYGSGGGGGSGGCGGGSGSGGGGCGGGGGGGCGGGG